MYMYLKKQRFLSLKCEIYLFGINNHISKMALAKTEKKLKTPQKLNNLPSRYKVVYLHVYNLYRGSCLTLHILSTTTYLQV